ASPCAALFPYRPVFLPYRVGNLVPGSGPHSLTEAAGRLPELLWPALSASADRLLGSGAGAGLCHTAMGRRIRANLIWKSGHISYRSLLQRHDLLHAGIGGHHASEFHIPSHVGGRGGNRLRFSGAYHFLPTHSIRR